MPLIAIAGSREIPATASRSQVGPIRVVTSSPSRTFHRRQPKPARSNATTQIPSDDGRFASTPTAVRGPVGQGLPEPGAAGTTRGGRAGCGRGEIVFLATGAR